MRRNSNDKIDIVITWVDGNDEEWMKEKEKYSLEQEQLESTNNARFRDWDNLVFLFRSIEQHMPWVNKVYLVTCGQIPKWLDINCEKVKVVFHEEFIPKEFLPTFNSHTIELNLHRINGLSEKFIYFNDDIFVLKDMKPKDFFKSDLPCDSAILNVHCVKKSRMIYNIACNDVAIINEHFDIKNTIKGNKYKWFNMKYGVKNNIQNFIFSVCPRFPGFKQFHMTNSYLKSTFEEVWNKEYEYLYDTCLNKFRQKNDVNQWLIREWQLVKNNFYPTPKHKVGTMIDFEKEENTQALKKCISTIKNSSTKLICINDGDTIEDYEHIRSEIYNALENKFSKKSSFEK